MVKQWFPYTKLLLIIGMVVKNKITSFFSTGLFENQTGDVSDAFFLMITPAGWTFGAIWGTIYMWQFIWMIYALTTVCRKDDDGRYIYRLGILPPAFYVMFMVNNIVVVTWLFVWDRQWLNWACLVIVFAPITLYICLIISFKRLYDNLASLRRNGQRKDIWLTRILVQNGLAFFATWVSIATLLNFAIVLTYYWSVDVFVSSTIALGVLSLDIIVWFTLDTFFLDKYVRYTISPYIVLVVALTGSFTKNFDLDTNRRNSIYIAGLLGVAGVLLLVKLVLVAYRHRKYPITGDMTDDVKGVLA